VVNPPAIRPSVSGFSVSDGNISPVAGTLSGQHYTVDWAIAQASHANAVRIVGFKGTGANPSSVTLIQALQAAVFAHGSARISIPPGVTLAADEVYTLRLEAYVAGQTPATDPPTSYQDIQITAHAAAAAAYHVGYVQYDSDDSGVADTLARIADFSGDTATAAALPASMEIDVPDDSNSYQLYLAAKASETQPTGFTSAGLPATGSFYGAQSKTISGVDYKFYILRPTWRVTSADNGDTFGVTS